MARKPQITRAIEATKVTVLCLNTETAEPFNKVIVLARKYKTNDKLMAKVREEIDNDTEKAVKIVSSEVFKELYGMSETDFIKNAVKLDAKTRKPVATPTETENN